VGVMAFLKRTKNWSGVYPKLKVAMAFLKYAEITVASIQLTLKKTTTYVVHVEEIFDKYLNQNCTNET
jgi:hypothetical protein